MESDDGMGEQRPQGGRGVEGWRAGGTKPFTALLLSPFLSHLAIYFSLAGMCSNATSSEKPFRTPAEQLFKITGCSSQDAYISDTVI